MTIQELGSLGELVGAVAVLVTLVYLSIQTRQSRIAAQETAKFAELQATHSLLDLYFDWRNTLFSNPEHKEIVAKANLGSELDEAEKFALSLLFHDLFFAAAYSDANARAGGSIHETGVDVEYVLLLLKENPAILREWLRVKHMVSELNAEFVVQVDRSLEGDV